MIAARMRLGARAVDLPEQEHRQQHQHQQRDQDAADGAA
jgi:hypothetical protein